MCCLIPGDTRITKIRQMQVEYRISLVLSPSASVIEAVSNVLCLAMALRSISIPRIDRNQALTPESTKAAAVLAIDYDAASEDHLPVFLGNGDRQFMPMQQVRTDCMPPAHISPLVAEWVVLEEQVVFTLKIDKAVRIIRPMFVWREVYLRAVGLIICRSGLSMR